MKSLSSLSILDAMSAPTLFAPWFRRKWMRADSWKAWRAFLAVLFGLAIDPETHEIYQRHTGRTDTPTAPFVEAWLAVGRRGGKSLIAALIVTYLAVFKDYSEILAPGEIGLAMCIASDRKQAQVVLGYVKAFFRKIPMLRAMVIAETKEAIHLKNGVHIEVHTASYRAVRGYTVVGVVLDEVAFFRTEDSATPDVELVNALRPAMSTVPGALLLAISSPYARRGSLWETYREHFGKAGSGVLVWQADTRSMNPTVSRQTIEAAYLRDPASAAAEYGAEFRSDLEAFITRELIDPVVIPGRLELPYIAGTRYHAFCDPSGGSSDSMTLAIAHVQDGRAVLDLMREVKPPFSPEATTREFSALLKLYKVSTVVGDAYGGEWPREQFRKFGPDYKLSEQNRSEIYLTLLAAISSSQVELLDSQRLIGQLCSLERRTARSGKDNVDHQPGGHDDLANAAAGALVCALGSAGSGWIVTADFETVKGILTGLWDGAATKVVEATKDILASSNGGQVAPEAPPVVAERCPRCGGGLTRQVECGVWCRCGWRRPLEPGEAASLAGRPEFRNSTAAQKSAAVASDGRAGHYLGSGSNRNTPQPKPGLLLCPTPNCGASLAQREDAQGNTIQHCGRCNYDGFIPFVGRKRRGGGAL